MTFLSATLRWGAAVALSFVAFLVDPRVDSSFDLRGTAGYAVSSLSVAAFALAWLSREPVAWRNIHRRAAVFLLADLLVLLLLLAGVGLVLFLFRLPLVGLLFAVVAVPAVLWLGLRSLALGPVAFLERHTAVGTVLATLERTRGTALVAFLLLVAVALVAALFGQLAESPFLFERAMAIYLIPNVGLGGVAAWTYAHGTPAPAAPADPGAAPSIPAPESSAP